MFLRSTARTARKAYKLTAIWAPTVYKMSDTRRLTTLWASTACYRDSFALKKSELIRPRDSTHNKHKHTHITGSKSSFQCSYELLLSWGCYSQTTLSHHILLCPIFIAAPHCQYNFLVFENCYMCYPAEAVITSLQSYNQKKKKHYGRMKLWSWRKLQVGCSEDVGNTS
jgi:hypothetical protein